MPQPGFRTRTLNLHTSVLLTSLAQISTKGQIHVVTSVTANQHSAVFPAGKNSNLLSTYLSLGMTVIAHRLLMKAAIS